MKKGGIHMSKKAKRIIGYNYNYTCNRSNMVIK